jgi:hypothetical protein
MWAPLHRGFCIEVCAAFMSCVHTNKKRKAFEMYIPSWVCISKVSVSC